MDNTSDTNVKMIERYVTYVQRTLGKYRQIGGLAQGGEVSPTRVNWALSQLFDMGLMLNSEYQRAKMQFAILEGDYQRWYDEKFIEARQTVHEFYHQNKSIKPSVKEYEIQLRHTNAIDYQKWQVSMKEAESTVEFLLRIREQLQKYDSILVTLSANMRNEMKNLTVQDRGGKPSEQFYRRRIVSQEPEVDPLTLMQGIFEGVQKERELDEE